MQNIGPTGLQGLLWRRKKMEEGAAGRKKHGEEKPIENGVR